MGNSAQNNYSWPDNLKIINSSSSNTPQTLMNPKTGDLFWLRSYSFTKGPNRIFQEAISHRKRLNSPFLVSLYSDTRRELGNLCSDHFEYTLLFKHPGYSLEELLEVRRSRKQYFSIEQVQLLIKKVIGGLEHLQKLEERKIQISLRSIFFQKDIRLMDPIINCQDDTYASLKNQRISLPSPQLFHPAQSGSQDIFQSYLFSLGMIALQLSFPTLDISTLYEISQYHGRSFRWDRLGKLLDGIGHPPLKQQIKILTDLDPHKRRNILEFLGSFKMSESNASRDTHENDTSTQQKPQNHKTSIKIEKKNVLPIQHQPKLANLNAQMTLNNQQIVPPISFKYNTQTALQNLNQNSPVITILDPPIRTFTPDRLTNKNRGKENNSLLKPTVQETPAKKRGRKMFSTIKQVTENQNSSGSGSGSGRRQYVEEEWEEGKYEGEKMNGLRQGKGRLTYSEGSYYDGEWRADQIWGFGRLFYCEGKLAYQGEWEAGEFYGRGTVYNDSPCQMKHQFDFRDLNWLGEEWVRYEGELKRDNKEGFGRLVLADGSYFEGEFKADKAEGEGKFRLRNGRQIHGVWHKSVLINIRE